MKNQEHSVQTGPPCCSNKADQWFKSIHSASMWHWQLVTGVKSYHITGVDLLSDVATISLDVDIPPVTFNTCANSPLVIFHHMHCVVSCTVSTL